jgi:signal transduction histidine kinase
MKKGVVLIIIFYGSFSSLFAQNQRLRDLQDALALSTKRSFGEVLKQIQPFIDSLDFITAQKELQQTIEICETLTHRRLVLPQVYDMLANICRQHNRPDLALEYYLKSIETYEKAGFKKALAHTYYRIGFLHFTAKHYGRADSYLRKALKVSQDSLENRQVINAYNAIALGYKDVKNYPLTVQYFDKALEIAKSEQDSVWIGIIYSNIGTVQLEKGEYGDALTYFRNGLRMNLAYGGEAENIATMQNAMGDCYFKLKNSIAAEKYYTEGLQTASKANIKKGLEQSYRGLAKVKAARGEFEKAYQFYDLYKKINDSVNLQSKNVAVLEMQHQFDVEKKDMEIEVLNSHIEVHYFQRVGLVSGTVFLLLMTFFLMRNYRKQYKNNVLLQEQNTEIQQQKEEISMQAEALTHLNQTKDKLFSIISHDLRSPLNSLRGALDLLEMQNLSQADFQRISTDLRKNVDTVHGTLENLLQWAYTQMKGINTQTQVIDLKDITDEITALYQAVATEKEINLSNLVRSKILIKADKNQIRLVIRNLVGNALKFTQAGGKVTLSAEILENRMIFTVADTGVGMNTVELGSLFSSQAHFSKRGTANEKGTGLGLLLCKEFVENNQGKIWVKSKPLEGSAFYFSLPVAT